MTISSTLRKAGPYVGNGVSTSFAFAFKVFLRSDVVVTLLEIATGVETVLTLDTHYTVTLNADQNTTPGGTVTYNPSGTPMASTHTLTLTSGVAQTQGTDIPNAGGFYPEVIEDALDKAVILVQQLWETVSRTMRVPVSSTIDPALPTPAGGEAIGWNAAGTALINIALSAGTTLADLAASTGAALVGFVQGGAGAILRAVQDKLRDRISIKDFGAVGDFDPSTGTGTDDRVAIQAAIDYAVTQGNCAVMFDDGNFYLGTLWSNSTGSDANANLVSQLYIGDMTSTIRVSDVTLRGNGGILFAGTYGSVIGLFHTKNITIDGLKIRGYAGWAGAAKMTAGRDYDHLISVNLGCDRTRIQNCYLSNCVGWTIALTGDPRVSHGGTGNTNYDTVITGNTLIDRYGNGVPAFQDTGGSRTQHSIQANDAIGLLISNNTIYGTVDLESSLTGQYMQECVVTGNRFDSGWVTPIVPTGADDSTAWAEETIVREPAGTGTRLRSGIAVQTDNGSPTQRANLISNNFIEYGDITILAADRVGPAAILNNRFRYGKINIGLTVNIAAREFQCNGNIADYSTDGAGFIHIGGYLSNATFLGNIVFLEDVPVIYADAAQTGELSGCVFKDNLSMVGTTQAISWSGGASGPNNGSIYKNNLAMAATGAINAARYAPYEQAVGAVYNGLIAAGGADQTVTVTNDKSGSSVLLITASAMTNGGLGHSRAMWLVGGNISDGTYSFTEVVRANSGASSVINADFTAHNGYVTFSITNGSGVQNLQYTVTVSGAGYVGADPVITAA